MCDIYLSYNYSIMQLDRKSKLITEIQRPKKSVSLRKLNTKQKHLLSKPLSRKNSCQKNTQSFSTMFSHQNISKNSTLKLNKTSKLKKGENFQIIKQMSVVTEKLEREIQNIDRAFDKDGRKWFSIVQDIRATISNHKLRKVFEVIQNGYRHQS